MRLGVTRATLRMSLARCARASRCCTARLGCYRSRQVFEMHLCCSCGMSQVSLSTPSDQSSAHPTPGSALHPRWSAGRQS